jgi:hypothetical protein
VTSPPHLSGRWWVAVAEVRSFILGGDTHGSDLTGYEESPLVRRSLRRVQVNGPGPRCFARSVNVHSTVSLAETVVRTSAAIKPHQGAPIFTHPLHHPANATLFPAKSAQEPIESPVFL